MSRSGFTMIELVIVMAVIAILALMAVPTFLDRNVRLQVEEGMTLATLAKSGVSVFYGAKNELPANNEEAGIPPRHKIVANYVSEVAVEAGAVTVTFGNNVNSSVAGKRLTLRPAIVKDAPAVPIAWLCHNVAVPKGMEAMGANRSDIPAKWLPLECRG